MKFECPKCDFEFKQIGGLTKHMSLFHPEPVVKLTIQENEIVELPSCMFYKQCLKRLPRYNLDNLSGPNIACF